MCVVLANFPRVFAPFWAMEFPQHGENRVLVFGSSDLLISSKLRNACQDGKVLHIYVLKEKDLLVLQV